MGVKQAGKKESLGLNKGEGSDHRRFDCPYSGGLIEMWRIMFELDLIKKKELGG